MCDQRGPHPVAASPGALPPWFVVAAVGTWLGLAAPLTRSRSLPPGSLQQVVMSPAPGSPLGRVHWRLEAPISLFSARPLGMTWQSRLVLTLQAEPFSGGCRAHRSRCAPGDPRLGSLPSALPFPSPALPLAASGWTGARVCFPYGPLRFSPTRCCCLVFLFSALILRSDPVCGGHRLAVSLGMMAHRGGITRLWLM